jgi:hypothetical protein
MMGNKNADGHTRSPRIAIRGIIDRCICKPKMSKGAFVFERAPFPFHGEDVDAEQLSVRQVEGTNYGEYFDADGNVIDPLEVVWHFEYKGTPQQKAALMRIRVELIDEDDEAADEANDDDDDESEGDGADNEGEGEGEK